MMYFATFDLRDIGGGSIELSTPGQTDIGIALSAFTAENFYGVSTHEFNLVLGHANLVGPGIAGQVLMPGLPTRPLLGELTNAFSNLAGDEGWDDPSSIEVTFNPTTQRVTFAYPTGFSAVTFSTAAARGLFGFASSFSGSSVSVTGTLLPSYIVTPTIDGTSSPSVIYEDDAPMVAAYSATGRSYALARMAAPMRRSWVQQHEPLAKTYRRHSTGDYTYEELFEQCRAGRPFAVYGGFADSEYTAYYFDEDGASFHPAPATPGNADQFHIPFKTIVVGVP